MNLGNLRASDLPDSNVDKLLVVVDMQYDFVFGKLGTQEAFEIILPLQKFIESFDGDVVYTQDTHDDNYLNTQEGKRLPVPHCIRGTKGHDIIPELNPVWRIEKNTFGSVALFDILSSDNSPYKEIHFAGVCTGICVIANAVIAKTAMPEVRIVIHKDLCVCVTPESHEIALKAMQTLQMDIV